MIQSLSLSELFLRWNWFSKHEMETLSEGLFSNKNLTEENIFQIKDVVKELKSSKPIQYILSESFFCDLM